MVGGARGPVQEPGPPPSPSASVSTVTCALGFCPGLAVCLCPVTSSYHSANGNILCRGQGCFSLAFVSTAFCPPGQNTLIWSAYQVCLWMTCWILDKTGEQTPRRNVHSHGDRGARGCGRGPFLQPRREPQHQGTERRPQDHHTAHILELRAVTTLLQSPNVPCAVPDQDPKIPPRPQMLCQIQEPWYHLWRTVKK